MGAKKHNAACLRGTELKVEVPRLALFPSSDKAGVMPGMLFRGHYGIGLFACAEYGNTSAASIPLALDEAVRGNVISSGNVVSVLPEALGMYSVDLPATSADEPVRL